MAYEPLKIPEGFAFPLPIRFATIRAKHAQIAVEQGQEGAQYALNEAILDWMASATEAILKEKK